MKKVTLVELATFSKVVPLTSGYLWSYARTEPRIADGYDVRGYDAPVTADREEVLADLVGRTADVYGFSCYVWNMGLVRWLVDGLPARFPGVQAILGGPQVMGHAGRYVSPDRSNVVVCDGEGERTFRAYLRELLRGEPAVAELPVDRPRNAWSSHPEVWMTYAAFRIEAYRQAFGPQLAGSMVLPLTLEKRTSSR